MTNNEQKNQAILATWTSLKAKLLKTFQELKTNHKDNWALIKPPSGFKRIILARDKSREELNKRLALVQKLIAQQDYAKLQKLYDQGSI